MLLRMAALGLLAAGATATCVSVRAAHARPRTARTGRSPATARPNDETCSRSPATNVAFDPAVARRVAPVTTIHLVRPLQVQPPLGAGRLTFPLLGPYPGFFDTFGAPRPGVSWHHGDDLFAAKGKPVLAVTDESSSPSAGSDWADTDSGSRTAQETSSTTPISRAIRASRSTGASFTLDRRSATSETAATPSKHHRTCTSRSTQPRCFDWDTTAQSIQPATYNEHAKSAPPCPATHACRYAS